MALVDTDDRHSLDALDAQRVLANVSEGLFGRTLPQARVGRFVLLDKLGSGGMGVVYSAFDPRSDRRVAIKVLHDAHDEADEHGRERDRERLLREARALALVSHPNVVTVYEVGTIDERVFLAMELVDGQPLDRWLAERRPWREILEVFCCAGRGLAAAHAQGVVHRDFKPSNVVLGADERVVVLDFGLARSERIPLATDPSLPRAAGAPVDPGLTQTHALVGTPRYMSPEQFECGPVSRASDQFSWCVSLFEALYGEPPFEGDTVAELSAAVRGGELRSPRAPAQLPQWLAATVRRGLRVDPTQRFPSMDALLLALDEPSRRGWRKPVAWLALASAGALGAALLWPSAPALAPCTGGQARVEEVWNDTRRQAVHAAFDGVALAFAEDSRRAASEALDDYAERWVQAHHEACTATRVRGGQSEAQLDRRMICLQERLESLDALAELLTHADAAVVRNAVTASWQLPELEPCADAATRLAEGPALDAQSLERRTGWRRAIARAVAKRDAGKHEAAQGELEALMAELAQAPPDLRVRAEVGIELGIVQEKTGEHEAAAAVVERALWDAVNEDDLGLQARAATQLVTIVGWQLRAAEQGHTWSRMAQAVLARLGDPTFGVSKLESALGNLSYSEGDFAAAVEHKRRALELRQTLRPANDPRLATLHGDLGLFLGQLGRASESLAHHRIAVALRERSLGPAHPQTAMAYNGLAGQLRRTGQLEESLELYERARAQYLDAFGPDHTKVAMVDNNMANTLAVSGEASAAIPHYREAIRIWMAAPESHGVRIANARSNLGMVLVQQGHVEDGIVELNEALRVYTEKLGEDHAETTPVHINLSIAKRELGQPEAALVHAEIALRLTLRDRTREHDLFAQAKIVEGEALAKLDRIDEAILALEEGASVLRAIPTSASERADVYLALANLRTARASATDHVAALAWVREALEQVRHDERPDPERIATLTQWLVEHEGEEPPP